MLEQDLKEQLGNYLTRLTGDVEITAFADDSAGSKQMLQLLADITSVSPRVSVKETRDANERTPSFALARPGESPRIRFAGLPLGHEFTSLVLGLLQVGGYPPKVEAEVIEQIRALDGDYDFRTYISLTCQNCPDVVQALNLMAVLNPRIRHTMVDGSEFEQEVASLNIRSVPAVYLNDESFGQGRMGVEEILAKLDRGAATRKAAELSKRATYDMLIVGGGPAGASAAIYAARKGIRVGVAAERFGGQVLDTLGIENLISVKHTEGPQLATALEQNVKSLEVDVMNLQRAEKLVPGETFELKFAGGASLRAKSLVIATGARWRELGVPGEKEYRNRGVAYCPHCDGPLFKGKEVAVVGGGNSGVEAAIDLAGIVKHVTLLEFGPQLRADAVLVNKLKSLPNVHILTNAETLAVTGNDTEVTGLHYRDRATGAGQELKLAGVFVQIGLVPNTDWLKGTVALSPRGEIEVDARGQTSLPGVFAAGDCTTVPYKQIVIALGEGSKAALSAFDHLIRTPIAAAA
ncbi:MAG TPA: alkyl hydroperoxide reductase subunit F [Steroidobacteraceae bacterium]|nr:alkyl hydroperoxide reductase subunit F [Steroidobacteraceae bacterium]